MSIINPRPEGYGTCSVIRNTKVISFVKKSTELQEYQSLTSETVKKYSTVLRPQGQGAVQWA